MPRIFIIALLAACLSPMAGAQMRGRPSVTVGGTGFRHVRTGGFGYPLFYSDYGPDSTAIPFTPSVIIERKVILPDRPTEPLLIEWHGDRFVRYGETQKTEAPDYAEGASPRIASSPVRRDLPPAVLVYRDGHREEVSDYVITRGVLYARGDYSQSGSWMRDVPLSALDVAATMKANRDSGVRFVLPAGPNEVVTRP